MNNKGWLATVGAALSVGTVPLLLADRFTNRRPSVATEGERTESYWTHTAPPNPRFERLASDVRTDVAVIGGGFTGLATAYYLKLLDPSRRVTVLDSHFMGSGASSRNSGGVTPQFPGQPPMPEAERGWELLREFCDREDADVDLRECVPVIRLFREQVNSPHIQGETLTEQVGSGYYRSALTRTAHRVHPGKLVHALINANLRLNVEFYEQSPVLGISESSPRCLLTPGGEVRARDVVVATNAYTPQLGLARDIIVGVHHRVIVTRPLSDEEWQQTGFERWPYRLEPGDYTHTIRATKDRRFFGRHVLGHRPFEQTDWKILERDREVGNREMVRRYPWLEGVDIEFEWHGVSTRTRNLWPVSGKLDENLYIAAGFNGVGVIPTHYFGYLLAHSIVGKPHQDFSLFRPPSTHSRVPNELLRHLLVQGALTFNRCRDQLRPSSPGRGRR